MSHDRNLSSPQPCNGSAIYHDPTTLYPEQVCPHCKRKTTEYRFMTDGHLVITHHCPKHRDVIPIRSVIVRGDTGVMA